MKKKYEIMHESTLLKLLFQRLYPHNQIEFASHPIEAITQFFSEYKKIEDEVSSETLEIFGGAERVLALPETTFFHSKILNITSYVDLFIKRKIRLMFLALILSFVKEILIIDFNSLSSV